MIDELYFVFKPLLVTFAAIIIPVVGIVIFFGGCAVAVKAARLLVAAVRNRSWKTVLGNKANALVDRLGDKTGERIASEINRLNNAAIEAQKARCVDYRVNMLGKWYDDSDNSMEIYEEGGVYVLHFTRCESDPQLHGVRLILRAAILRTTDPNILTTAGNFDLDMAYSKENDTIFMADLGTTFRRMSSDIEDYFSWRESFEKGEFDTPHPVFLQEAVDAASEIREPEPFASTFDDEGNINSNIIV